MAWLLIVLLVVPGTGTEQLSLLASTEDRCGQMADHISADLAKPGLVTVQTTCVELESAETLAGSLGLMPQASQRGYTGAEKQDLDALLESMQ